MMKDFQRCFILINNMSLRNDPSYVRVSLKDREGKTIRKIEENALFSDKNFRDISGLYIGLREAEHCGVKRIMVLTDNSFLGTIIKNGLGESYVDYYGFYYDIKRLMCNFEEVGVKVVA
jgi:hypothetical protein